MEAAVQSDDGVDGDGGDGDGDGVGDGHCCSKHNCDDDNANL
jgi:hypothetical protein